MQLDKDGLVKLRVSRLGMDVVGEIEDLSNDPRCIAIPVVAVTASAMTEDIQRMVDAGFDGIETKLISVKNFLVTVAEVLKKKSIAT